MPVKTFRPLTPSTRYITISDYSDITKKKPEKSLVVIRKKTGGRNTHGRVTARGIGGGHKQKIRLVDFKRNKHGMEAEVSAIEYDPIRTARLALLTYTDGEKRYIVAPVGLKVGAKIVSGPTAPPEIGNCVLLKNVPVGLPIHAIEIMPGRGAQMVRSAGSAATLMSVGEGYAQIRLPSGEIRKINEECYATIGQVGTPSTRKLCSEKLVAAAIEASVRLAAEWRATRSTIRTVVDKASQSPVAAGSSSPPPGVWWRRESALASRRRIPTGSSWSAAMDAQ